MTPKNCSTFFILFFHEELHHVIVFMTLLNILYNLNSYMVLCKCLISLIYCCIVRIFTHIIIFKLSNILSLLPFQKILVYECIKNRYMLKFYNVEKKMYNLKYSQGILSKKEYRLRFL